MAYKKTYCKCGKIRHPLSKSGLCRKCYRIKQLETARKYQPDYLALGGSQWRTPDGLTHYQKNKQYYKDRTDKRRAEIRNLINEYKKNVKCTDCSVSDYRVIEFDHLGDKSFDISWMVSRMMSWNKILGEIKKCEPVCANCHRIRTHKRKAPFA